MTYTPHSPEQVDHAALRNLEKMAADSQSEWQNAQFETIDTLHALFPAIKIEVKAGSVWIDARSLDDADQIYQLFDCLTALRWDDRLFLFCKTAVYEFVDHTEFTQFFLGYQFHQRLQARSGLFNFARMMQ